MCVCVCACLALSGGEELHLGRSGDVIFIADSNSVFSFIYEMTVSVVFTEDVSNDSGSEVNSDHFITIRIKMSVSDANYIIWGGALYRPYPPILAEYLESPSSTETHKTTRLKYICHFSCALHFLKS